MVQMNRGRKAGLNTSLVVTCVLIAVGLGGAGLQAEAFPPPSSLAEQSRSSLNEDIPCYFPLEVGNRWVFVMTRTPDDQAFDPHVPDPITVEVTGSYQDGDRQIYLLHDFMFPFVVGQSRFFNDLPGQATELLDQQSGVWYPWWLFGSGLWAPITLPLLGNDCIHGSSGHFVGLSTVTVPAGTFEHAAVIVYDSDPCSDVGLSKEVFAPGVGLIERSVMTGAGPVTWSLSYAQAGGRAWGAPAPSAPLGAKESSASDPGAPLSSTISWGALKSTFSR